MLSRLKVLLNVISLGVKAQDSLVDGFARDTSIWDMKVNASLSLVEL